MNEEQKKTKHTVRNTLMTLAVGGGIGVSAYKVGRHLPGGWTGILRQYVTNPEQLSDLATIMANKVTLTPKHVDMQRLLGVIDRIQSNSAIEDYALKAQTIEAQIADVTQRIKPLSARYRELRLEQLMATGNQEWFLAHMARPTRKAAIAKFKAGEKELIEALNKAGLSDLAGLTTTTPARYQLDKLKDPNVKKAVRKIFKQVYGPHYAVTSRTQFVDRYLATMNKYRQKITDWRTRGEAAMTAMAAEDPLGKIKELKKSRRKLIAEHSVLLSSKDYGDLVSGSTAFMNQSQLRVQDAVIQAQIDLAEHIYGTSLNLKAGMGANLGKLPTRYQQHIRGISPGELPLLFANLNLPAGHVLPLETGGTLEESITSVRNWLTTIDKSSAFTADQKQFLVGALARRLRRNERLYMADITRVPKVGASVVGEYKGRDFIDKLLLRRGERSIIEATMLKQGRGALLKNLQELARTDTRGLEGYGLKTLWDPKAKTAQGFELSIGREKVFIPTSRGLTSNKAIQWTPSSLTAPESVEVSFRSALPAEEVNKALRKGKVRGHAARLARRMGLVEVTSDVAAMYHSNVYLNAVIDARRRGRQIDNYTVVENLKRIINTVMEKHSVFQQTQKELLAEGKEYRGVKDVLVAGDKGTVDEFLNPLRVHRYGTESIVNLELDLADLADVKFKEYPRTADIRKVTELFGGKGILTRELALDVNKWYAAGVPLREIRKRVNQYSKIRMDVGEKQVGERISGGMGPILIEPGAELRLTNFRSTLSGISNKQISSARAIAQAERLELYPQGKRGEEMWKAVYYHKAVSTPEAEAMFARYAKEGYNPAYEFSPTFDTLFLNEDVAKALEADKTLSPGARLALEKAARGHVVVSEELAPMLGHIRSETAGTVNYPDVERIMRDLESVGELGIGEGINLGEGTIIPGKRGTVIRGINIKPVNTTSNLHTIVVEREIIDPRYVKLFGIPGRERLLTQTVKASEFDEAMSFVESVMRKSKEAQFGKQYEMTTNLRAIRAFTAGKEIGEGGTLFRELNKYHLAVLSNLVTGRPHEQLVQRVGQDVILGAGNTAAERLAAIMATRVGGPLAEGDLTLIGRLSKMFGGKTLGTYGTPVTALAATEGEAYLQQTADVRSYLQKIGYDIQMPIVHSQVAPADIPRINIHPRLDPVAGMQMWMDNPLIFAEYMRNLEGAEHIQLATTALAPSTPKGKVAAAIETMQQAGKAEVVKLEDLAARTTMSTADLNALYMSGDAERLNYALNTAAFGNKSIIIDLGRETELHGAKFRYLPILPRKLLSGIEGPFETPKGAVMGDVDAALLSLVRASRLSGEERKVALERSMDYITSTLVSKKGVLSEAMAPRQMHGISATPVFNPLVDEMADNLINIQNVNDKSLSQFTKEYFQTKNLTDIRDSDIAKMLQDIQKQNMKLSNQGTIALTEAERKFGAAGINVPSHMIESYEGANRNIYEDIINNKVMLVKGDVRGKKMMQLRYAEEVEAWRHPLIPYTYREHMFANLQSMDDVFEQGRRLLMLMNEDFDFDIHNIAIVDRARTTSKLAKEMEAMAPDYFHLFTGTAEKRMAALAGMTDSPHTMAGMAKRTSQQMAKYAEEVAKEARGEPAFRGEFGAGEEWAKAQSLAAEKAAQISFTGRATRTQQRILLGMKSINDAELMKITGLKTEMDVAKLRWNMGLLTSALPQEVIKVKAGAGTVEAETTLDLIKRYAKTTTDTDADLAVLWEQLRPAMVEQWGAGAYEKPLIAPMGEAMEAAPGVLTDYGKGFVKSIKHSWRGFYEKYPVAESLFPETVKHPTRDALKLFDFMTSGDKTPVSMMSEIPTELSRVSRPKGVLAGLAQIARTTAKSGAWKSSLVGLGTAAGIYAMSAFGSGVDKRLDNRPEAYLMQQDSPRTPDNLVSSPGYAHVPIQVAPPQPELTTQYARLHAPSQAKMVNVEYESGGPMDRDLDLQKLNSSAGSNRVNVIYEDANKSEAYLRYKAARKM